MPRVILIEDDPTMRTLLQTLIEMEGYEVSAIARGADALVEMRADKPELVLLDVHLKETNGFDLLKQIRADEQLKDIYVLMSSGMDLADACVRAGADDFILKPYMPDELTEKLRTLLGS